MCGMTGFFKGKNTGRACGLTAVGAAILFVFTLLGGAGCTGAGEPETPATGDTIRKYTISSGIIQFEMRNEMLAAEKEAWTFKLYFDNYGAREAKETYINGVLVGKVVDDGKNYYEINFEKKIGTREKSRGLGTEMPYAPERLPPGVKTLANMNVAGKNCRVFQTEDKNINASTAFAGWNGIILMTEMRISAGNKTITDTTIATSVTTNVEIPVSVFEIPADIKIYEARE